MPYPEKEGYFKIRCTWYIGCPAVFNPLIKDGKHGPHIRASRYYKQAFEALFLESLFLCLLGLLFTICRDKREDKEAEEERLYGTGSGCCKRRSQMMFPAGSWNSRHSKY